MRNALERAVLLCIDKAIGLEHLPLKITQPESIPNLGDLITLEKIEEMHIRRVLAATSPTSCQAMQEGCSNSHFGQFPDHI